MVTVLIGPPGAGKTTVGRRVAALTSRRFVDADEASDDWYASVGWNVARLTTRTSEVGFERAHAEWETALAAAVVGLTDTATDVVLALGAGHTHITDSAGFERVWRSLAAVDQVVLLLPYADREASYSELRRRCVRDKKHDWVRDGVDWIARWLDDGLDERLATHTIVTDDETPDDTARRVARLCGDAADSERDSDP